MQIPFVGGPYDGLKLGVVEVQKHLVILSVPGRRGLRRFAYLPSPEDWPDVLSGRIRVDDSEVYHYYELLSTPQGPQFRSDEGGRLYRTAIGEASAAPALGRGDGGHPPDDAAD